MESVRDHINEDTELKMKKGNKGNSKDYEMHSKWKREARRNQRKSGMGRWELWQQHYE